MIPDRAHNDCQTAHRTIAALERKRSRRFLIAAGFYKQHLPLVAPKRYWDLCAPSAVSLTGHPGLAEGAADFMYRYAEIHSYGIEPGVLFGESKPATAEQARKFIHAY